MMRVTVQGLMSLIGTLKIFPTTFQASGYQKPCVSESVCVSGTHTRTLDPVTKFEGTATSRTGGFVPPIVQPFVMHRQCHTRTVRDTCIERLRRDIERHIVSDTHAMIDTEVATVAVNRSKQPYSTSAVRVCAGRHAFSSFRPHQRQIWPHRL